MCKLPPIYNTLSSRFFLTAASASLLCSRVHPRRCWLLPLQRAFPSTGLDGPCTSCAPTVSPLCNPIPPPPPNPHNHPRRHPPVVSRLDSVPRVHAAASPAHPRVARRHVPRGCAHTAASWLDPMPHVRTTSPHAMPTALVPMCAASPHAMSTACVPTSPCAVPTAHAASPMSCPPHLRPHMPPRPMPTPHVRHLTPCRAHRARARKCHRIPFPPHAPPCPMPSILTADGRCPSFSLAVANFS